MYYILNYVLKVKPMAVDVAVLTGFVYFLPSGILFCILASIITLKVKPILTRILKNA